MAYMIKYAMILCVVYDANLFDRLTLYARFAVDLFMDEFSFFIEKTLSNWSTSSRPFIHSQFTRDRFMF